MNESIKNMLERRSIRAYKKDLVPQETLDMIPENIHQVAWDSRVPLW